MPRLKRRRSVTSPPLPLPGRASPARAVALGSGVLLLLGSAFQASFAGPVGGGGKPDYEPTPPVVQDEKTGISSGEAGAIAAASTFAGFGVSMLLGGGGGGEEEAEEPGESFSPPEGPIELSTPPEGAKVLPLPEGRTDLVAARLVPGRADLRAGGMRLLDLQVRSKSDGKWYSVTARDETTLELARPDAVVVRQDGRKNAFCVPLTAPRSADGRSVTVKARFAPKGRAGLSAECRLRVRVPEQVAGN